MISITPGQKSFVISLPTSAELDVVGYIVHGVKTADLLNGDFTPTGAKKGEGTCLESGPGTNYTIPVDAGEWNVKVAAVDIFGADNLNYSAMQTFTVLSDIMADDVAPDAVTGLALTTSVEAAGVNGTSEIVASWDACLADDLLKYVLQLRKGAEPTATPYTVKKGETTLTFSGLISGVSYSVRIAAMDRWGNESDYSAWVTSAAAPDAVPPPAITDLVAIGSFRTIRLNWTNPSVADVAYYEVHRSLTNSFAAATVIDQPTTGFGYTDVDLTSNVEYFYWITATDYSGNTSTTSNGVSATTIQLASEDLATKAKVTFVLYNSIFNFTAGSSTTLNWTEGSIKTDEGSFALSAGSLSSANNSYIIATLANSVATLAAVTITDTLPDLDADTQVILALTSSAVAPYENEDDRCYICYVREANSMQIEGALIRNATIESGKILNLTADKIVAGDLKSENYVTEVSGSHIDMVTGEFEFNVDETNYIRQSGTGLAISGAIIMGPGSSISSESRAEIIAGLDVTDGSSTYTATVFLQDSNYPIGTPPPAPTGGAYNFVTSTLTAPTSSPTWVKNQPSTTTTPTWACTRTFVGDPADVANTAGVWANVYVDAVAGGAGAGGTSVAVVEMYKEGGGTLPTDTSYDFTTGVVTGTLNGWAQSMPAVTTTAMYMTTCRFSVTAPATTQDNSAWTAQTVVAQKGAAGASITGVTNYYLAHANATGVTTATLGWNTDPATQTISSGTPYLWNYESVAYTSGSPTNTPPTIIGNYAASGTPGKGISSITEYYAVSTSNSTAPDTWYTTLQTMTATNKYLWNYEVITYTDSTTYSSLKRVIGVYGDKGIQGDSVTGDKGDTGDTGPSGASAHFAFCSNTISSPPATPTGSANTGIWYETQTTASVWMSTKTSTSRSTGTWGAPMLVGHSKFYVLPTEAAQGKGYFLTDNYFGYYNNIEAEGKYGWQSYMDVNGYMYGYTLIGNTFKTKVDPGEGGARARIEINNTSYPNQMVAYNDTNDATVTIGGTTGAIYVDAGATNWANAAGHFTSASETNYTVYVVNTAATADSACFYAGVSSTSISSTASIGESSKGTGVWGKTVSGWGVVGAASGSGVGVTGTSVSGYAGNFQSGEGLITNKLQVTSSMDNCVKANNKFGVVKMVMNGTVLEITTQ